MIENKKYYIDQINSSKAYQFTCAWHYSGSGFKKAILNLGVFRKEDNLLVGVLQWGCSFQEKIRLDRYVKEPIDKLEYLELNRFCMADSEGKNAESLAISLGIKWIKKYCPEIRLLVSYAGRKEGNYGYIYQATNWEYLGYFVSPGFYLLDGKECHLTSLWNKYNKEGNKDLPFTEAICEMHSDVRKTWTKQFVYIWRLDKTLTPASKILPYPKPSTDYPICIKIKIYKQNDDVFNSYVMIKKDPPLYYYEESKLLFTNTSLSKRLEQISLIDHKEETAPKRRLPKLRSGEYIPNESLPVAMYNAGGDLECVMKSTADKEDEGYLATGVRKAIRTGKPYKFKYFTRFEDEAPEEIEVPFICIIDEIPFNSYAEAGRYLNISRQAIQQAHQRKSKQIVDHEIIWIE